MLVLVGVIGFLCFRAGVGVWLFWDRLRRRRLIWSITHAILTTVVVLALLWGFAIGPAFAWLLVRVFPIPAPYATGLILLGMAVEPVWCPDGELAASMTSIRYYRPIPGAGGRLPDHNNA